VIDRVLLGRGTRPRKRGIDLPRVEKRKDPPLFAARAVRRADSLA